MLLRNLLLIQMTELWWSMTSNVPPGARSLFGPLGFFPLTFKLIVTLVVTFTVVDVALIVLLASGTPAAPIVSSLSFLPNWMSSFVPGFRTITNTLSTNQVAVQYLEITRVAFAINLVLVPIFALGSIITAFLDMRRDSDCIADMVDAYMAERGNTPFKTGCRALLISAVALLCLYFGLLTHPYLNSPVATIISYYFEICGTAFFLCGGIAIGMVWRSQRSRVGRGRPGYR